MKKIIQRTKGFEKSFQKLPTHIQKKFIEKLSLFLDTESHPALNTHKLKGHRKNEWSFSVTSDVRAIYKKDTKTNTILFLFINIGTHNKVY